MSMISVSEEQDRGTSCRQPPKAMTAVAAVLALGLMADGASGPAAAEDAKPNILFIMGDDIGWMQVGAYHRGIGLGETPNIDRLANRVWVTTADVLLRGARRFAIALALGVWDEV
jgi:hypothetical protein